MKMIGKKLLAAVLVCAMLLSMGGCACANVAGKVADSVISGLRATPAPQTSEPVVIQSGFRKDVPFSSMTYERPDLDGLESKMKALEEQIAAGGQIDTLISDYREVLRLYNEADSQLSLVYLLYSFDVTNTEYQTEYLDLQKELSRLDLTMTDVSIALFQSSEEAEKKARATFGDDFVDTVYNEESLNSEEIQTLLNQEQNLTQQYDRLCSSFTVTYQGRKWSESDIYNDDTLDSDQFYQLYDAYYAALNQAAGAIYMEQAGLRTQIAQKLGYGSYAAYVYDCYGRDYTLEDAKTLHKAVKKYLVPVYLRATARAALDGAERKLNSSRFSQNTFLEQLTAAAADFSPKLSESLNFMLRNGLYDFSVDPNKMEGSFTTFLSQYGTPFIFSQWENDASCPGTVMHELGHFTNYYWNDSVGWSAGDSLDLAEIDSQALVLLLTPYYDSFFGQYGEAAEKKALRDCMYAIISGCMEDEFQQRVYEKPDMTLEEINGVYRELCDEYGFADLYGYQGTEWVSIPHTFQTPMYYISYATSMIPAAELWRESKTDMEGAKRDYFAILERAPYAQFRTVLKENGMPDAFDPATIKELAKMLEAYTS